MKIIEDYFGFLPVDFHYSFGPVEIMALPDLETEYARLRTRVHPDGFFYQPEQEELFLGSTKMQSNLGKRPPHLYPMPSSHKIKIRTENDENHRKGVCGFVMHLLAYLYDTRLQFNRWWFDMRQPINPDRTLSFSKSLAEEFMLRCLQTWTSCEPKLQRLAVNLLYMHSRAPLYEWDWENFTYEYMVSDACWRLAKDLYKCKAVNHKERMGEMCSYFKIPQNVEVVDKIVTLRNNLFHEVLWDGSQPCLEGSAIGKIIVIKLRHLNKRLIAAILGSEMPFIQTEWWNLYGRYPLNHKP